MKKMLLVVAAAASAASCSPALFALPRQPHPTAAYRGHVRPFDEPLPIGRWDNVMRLPRGATIDVLTNDGAANVGAIAAASVDTVRVVVEGVDVWIRRADVVRVDLVALPGSEPVAVARKAVRGALLGAGLAALAAGVIGGEAWPPPAIALRTGAAVGGVTAGQVETMRRVGRLVYLAPEQNARPSEAPPRQTSIPRLGPR